MLQDESLNSNKTTEVICPKCFKTNEVDSKHPFTITCFYCNNIFKVSNSVYSKISFIFGCSNCQENIEITDKQFNNIYVACEKCKSQNEVINFLDGVFYSECFNCKHKLELGISEINDGNFICPNCNNNNHISSVILKKLSKYTKKCDKCYSEFSFYCNKAKNNYIRCPYCNHNNHINVNGLFKEKQKENKEYKQWKYIFPLILFISLVFGRVCCRNNKGHSDIINESSKIFVVNHDFYKNITLEKSKEKYFIKYYIESIKK